VKWLANAEGGGKDAQLNLEEEALLSKEKLRRKGG
jgi:hypothetical protein